MSIYVFHFLIMVFIAPFNTYRNPWNGFVPANYFCTKSYSFLLILRLKWCFVRPIKTCSIHVQGSLTQIILPLKFSFRNNIFVIKCYSFSDSSKILFFVNSYKACLFSADFFIPMKNTRSRDLGTNAKISCMQHLWIKHNIDVRID